MAKSAVTVFAMLAALHGAVLAQADGGPAESRMKFKGVPMWSPMSEVVTRLRLKCQDSSINNRDKVCVYAKASDNTYAGMPTKGTLFRFVAGRLDAVQIIMAPTDYKAVKQAMDMHFGEVEERGVDRVLSTYSHNGDRALLLYDISGESVLVSYESAAGSDARKARDEEEKSRQRRDM